MGGAALPRQPALSRPGGDPGLDALEVRDRAGYGDPSLVLKPVLFFGLSQKPAEEGMVKVNDGHQNAVKVAVFLAHVHSQVSLWNRHRLACLNRVLTQLFVARPRFAAAQRFGSGGQLPAPSEQLGHGFVAARHGRIRVEHGVSSSGSGVTE